MPQTRARARARFRQLRNLDGVDSGSYPIILSLRDGPLLLGHSWHFVPGYSHASLRDYKSPGDNNYLSASGALDRGFVTGLGELIGRHEPVLAGRRIKQQNSDAVKPLLFTEPAVEIDERDPHAFADDTF